MHVPSEAAASRLTDAPVSAAPMNGMHTLVGESNEGREDVPVRAGLQFPSRSPADRALGRATAIGSLEAEPNPGQMPMATPCTSGAALAARFDNIRLPNLTLAPVPPPITGNNGVDLQVRRAAAARGYQLRSEPADTALLVDVGDERLLQPQAAQAWAALRDAAAAAGITLQLDSAYRGYRYQTEVYFRKIENRSGLAEHQQRMRWSAPPGYSKHHTGYAIDVSQPGWAQFADSPAFAWLADRDYSNARRHGWAPSYPPDADRQGPDPEPWEYVWVGARNLVCPREAPPDSLR